MYKRIAVAVDGSKTSGKALQEAVGLASETGARILLLHVCEEMPVMWEPGGLNMMPTQDVMQVIADAGKELLVKLEQQVAARGLAVETRLTETLGGRAGSIISEEAKKWNADLLVVGTHGRKGVDHILMGSVAEGVIRTAVMPVLLIRGKE
ncbi:MAG: universal stress protein [Gallionellaceae bacterium]|nr:universal stress protein [Gallionellaceae bacterium]